MPVGKSWKDISHSSLTLTEVSPIHVTFKLYLFCETGDSLMLPAKFRVVLSVARSSTRRAQM